MLVDPFPHVRQHLGLSALAVAHDGGKHALLGLDRVRWHFLNIRRLGLDYFQAPLARFCAGPCSRRSRGRCRRRGWRLAIGGGFGVLLFRGGETGFEILKLRHDEPPGLSNKPSSLRPSGSAMSTREAINEGPHLTADW